MRYRLYFFGIIVMYIMMALSACHEATPEGRAFPILRTLNPSEVDEQGATFRAELVRQGGGETTSYGFVWDVEETDVNTSHKIILGTVATEGIFEARVEQLLADGAIYKVRAFAITGSRTIYGNTVLFASQGSASSPWSLETTLTNIKGGFSTHGSADAEYGYILYQYSEVYRYDPAEKTAAKIESVPASGGSGTLFVACSSGSVQFIFHNSSGKLFKLENSNWSVQSTIPFDIWNYSGYYLAFMFSEQVYILSAYKSFMYNPSTNVWQAKPKMPGGSFGGTLLGNKAYLMLKDKTIQEYNVDENTWLVKTAYPGKMNGDRIVSFSHGNKVYFGLCSNRELWSYQPDTDKWASMEIFPESEEFPDYDFFFYVKNKLHIGMRKEGYDYRIWSFDPDKGSN